MRTTSAQSAATRLPATVAPSPACPRGLRRRCSRIASCRSLVRTRTPSAAVAVKAAGHLYPAVPMLPAAPPSGRACGAASRHPPAAVAARVRLAVAWRVVARPCLAHHLLQDWVFSHPSTRPLLGFLRRTHSPDAADWPCHPLLPVAAPLPCPAPLDPTRRLSAPCRLSRRCWRRLSAPGRISTLPTGSAARLDVSVRLVMRQALALSRVVAPVAHTSCATHGASCAMSPQTWPFRAFQPPVFLNGQRQCLPLGGRYGLQPCRANRFWHASARNSSIIHLEIRQKLGLFLIRMARREREEMA
eukprot:COSAG04_NODE_5914_length_1457_cov_1.709867_1_plen_301_part_10